MSFFSQSERCPQRQLNEEFSKINVITVCELVMTMWELIGFFFVDVDDGGDKSMSEDSKSASFEDFLRILPERDTSIVLIGPELKNFEIFNSSNFWQHSVTKQQLDENKADYSLVQFICWERK